MKRVTALLLSLFFLAGLAACSRSGSVTPGNIQSTESQSYTPPDNSGAQDISGDHVKELCTYPWLDTYDMHYYVLGEDGSFSHFEDKELTVLLDSGKWQLLKNGEGQLTLHMEVSGGSAFDLYELELYEQSIYAHGLEDFIYIWLSCDEE